MCGDSLKAETPSGLLRWFTLLVRLRPQRSRPSLTVCVCLSVCMCECVCYVCNVVANHNSNNTEIEGDCVL